MNDFNPIAFLLMSVVFGVIICMVVSIIYVVIMNVFFPKKLKYDEIIERRKLIGTIRDSVVPDDWKYIMRRINSYRTRTGQRMSDVKYSAEKQNYRLSVKDFHIDIVYDANGTPDYTIYDTNYEKLLERKRLKYTDVKKPFNGRACVARDFDDMSGGM